MSFQSMIDTMSKLDRQTRSQYHLTLGQLIEVLESVGADTVVVFSDSGQHPKALMSYRGYYSDLCFDETTEPVTAKSLLTICEDALDEPFQGYKGGDFLMDASTPLWVSSYGSASSRAIVDYTRNEGVLVLDVKRLEP